MVHEWSTIMTYAWCMVALGCFGFEMLAPTLFYFLSFGIGALAGSIAAYMSFDFFVQCSICMVVGIVSFIAMHYWVKNLKRHAHSKTNVFGLIGKQAMVITPIQKGLGGTVKVGGEKWLAFDVHGGEIPAGAFVHIVHIQGVKLFVQVIE